MWLGPGSSRAPLRRAFAQIDPHPRGQLATGPLRVAGSFADVNDGKLSIRCDYLEFIVHRGNLQ